MELVHEAAASGRKICSSRDQTSTNNYNNPNKICVQTRVNNNNNIRGMTTFKKVDVVYYISRSNGHLEHPHYIQVTHLAHQPLRLKDVLDRLTALRGKGMPSLYSWSCKRSYKTGYVWNDLAPNDVIHPSEGGEEFVLKGSELLMGCTAAAVVDNAQQLQLQTQPKRSPLATKRHTDHQEMLRKQLYHPHEEDEECEVKTRYNICSKGVSTDEIEEPKSQNPPKHAPNELNLDTPSFSPPSTTSSTHSDILSNTEATIANNPDENNNKRLEDGGDPEGNEPMLSRNSMLFSLIACGGSGSFRKNGAPPLPPPCAAAPARKSFAGGSDLHRGVVCKAATAKMAAEDEEMIKYMSENPRMFGDFVSEEKEYFSGSIVEATANEESFGSDPALKKSSSFNHERSIKAGLGEAVEKEVKKEKGMKGKCIPRKKSSSKHSGK